MIFHSIRWRLQIWHGIILLAVLAGFGVTAYQVAHENQLRRIDQELNRRLMTLFRPQPPESRLPGFEARPEPPSLRSQPPDDRPPGDGPWEPKGDQFRGGRPFDRFDFLDRIREAVQSANTEENGVTNAVYFLLWQSDGTVLGRSPSAPADVPIPAGGSVPVAAVEGGVGKGGPFPGGPPIPLATRTRGEFREGYQFLPRGQCLLVGRSMASDLASMRTLALRLVAGGGAVLLLGLAGGWWLASRAIGPIESISATATRIAAGDLSQRIGAADTDSELGRLAAVLNSTFARLEAAFAHQARFTSDASHELRTPVSVILAQTQSALARPRSPEEYREVLEACQRSAQRMRALTESLLELARLDAGQAALKREPFELARVTREAVELVRPLAEARGIEICCELAPVDCLGDPVRVGQIATNLLSNAIHFNRERGRITVTTGRSDGGVSLTVSDTGEGIPAADLPHIFERFYRVDPSRSRAQGRTGLGLAICKAIADAHGGTIEVTSQPGVGSSFTLRLPSLPTH